MERKIRASLIAVALLLVCIVAGQFSRTAWSGSGSSGSFPGRYQLVVQGGDTQFVIDTQSGRVWYRYGTGARTPWHEEGPDVASAPPHH